MENELSAPLHIKYFAMLDFERQGDGVGGGERNDCQDEHLEVDSSLKIAVACFVAARSLNGADAQEPQLPPVTVDRSAPTASCGQTDTGAAPRPRRAPPARPGTGKASADRTETGR